MTLEYDQQTIEAAFVHSWDIMEQYFAQDSFLPHLESLKPTSNLITELRARGYDRQFRAGQSLSAFVLSRSLRHGLRIGQAALGMDLQPDGTMHVWYHEPPDTNIHINVDRVEITPEVEDFLTRLLAQPIN